MGEIIKIDSLNQSKIEIKMIGAPDVKIEELAQQCIHKVFMVNSVTPEEANLLKQEFIRVGGDVSVDAESTRCLKKEFNVLVMATLWQYNQAIELLTKLPSTQELIRKTSTAASNSIKVESLKQAREIILETGASLESVPLMAPKLQFAVIKLKDIRNSPATIIKQEFISARSDAAIHGDTFSCTVPKTDMLLMGTLRQYRRVIRRLKTQPSEIPSIAKEIEEVLQSEL